MEGLSSFACSARFQRLELLYPDVVSAAIFHGTDTGATENFDRTAALVDGEDSFDLREFEAEEWDVGRPTVISWW